MSASASEKIAKFFADYPLRTYKKGQILVHAGDPPGAIFYLAEGRVKQYDVTYRGDEVILNTFKPFAFFPMSYAINQTVNDFFLEAEEDIAVRRAPAEAVAAFVRGNPDVLYELLSRVYRGTEGLLARMAHLMGSSAHGRVLYEILVECRRFGQQTDGAYTIAVTEADIGARAGLARETVNREMHKLKKEGVIEVSAGHIVVPNIEVVASQLGTAV